MKRDNKVKKYVCIAKVGNNPDRTAKCIRHNLNDLLKYTSFLDTSFSSWTWFNVYSKKSRVQVGSFTKFKRPMTRDG